MLCFEVNFEKKSLMTTFSAEDLLIGAHTSAAGGAFNAIIEGKSIGATTIQFFTANQKQWKGKNLTEDKIALFKEAHKQTGLKKMMSHSSYLINLGSPDPQMLHKSREAFREEIERCSTLGLSFLNFHPGAALKDSKENCLDRIVESLLGFSDLLENTDLRLLLETTAGQGSSVGSTFEELAYILEKTKNKIPIGVCIDTCHIFAAGYDIRDRKSCDATLENFDQLIGLNHLYAFHLNDSLKELGTKRDRHAPLGEGKIGIECFKILMKNKKTRLLPKYLETPGGPPLWEKEIKMLREFAREP